MGDKTGIEWTDATWNVIYGCSRVSPGCEHCYAESFTHRFAGKGQKFEGLTVLKKQGPSWTGKIMLSPERLTQPLRWQRPRMIFVNSLSDVFHKDVPFEYIAAMFGVMALAQEHQFQILTKRSARMVEFFEWLEQRTSVIGGHAKGNKLAYCLMWLKGYNDDHKLGIDIPKEILNGEVDLAWPLNNVWMGVSVEDQPRADERIPNLQKVPAAIRFLSMEPLLGAVDDLDLTDIHWVILGGESGPGSRPMAPDWVRGVRDQCIAENVPFFMKQWGQYDEDGIKARSKKDTGCAIDGVDHKEWPVTASP